MRQTLETQQHNPYDDNVSKNNRTIINSNLNTLDVYNGGDDNE